MCLICSTGSICASTLQQHQDEFAPFCEYTDSVPTFDDYVKRVESTAEWGGHLELRAISMALNRPIHVYSVSNGKKPLKIVPPTMEQQEHDQSDAICLSYHLHYYALGEHYNQVLPS